MAKSGYINPLFLSDEDKKAEVEQIKTAISDKKILHEGNFGIGRVIECICYCQDVSPISDDDLKKFAELLAEQSIASNISEETLKKKIDDSSLMWNKSNSDKVKKKIDLIKMEFHDNYYILQDNLIYDVLEIYPHCGIAKLKDCINKVFVIFKGKGECPLSKDFLQSNDFFVPDLSKTIDPQEWDYVNFLREIAMSDKAFAIKLLSIFHHQEESHPENITLHQRILFQTQFFPRELVIEANK